ncbi:hypothetical protein [Nocardioides panacihumi]|uniref:hypothetical protein n=1 Tax=Nocardioides panacihumi TaxID=400774 RepID=UPI0031CF087D
MNTRTLHLPRTALLLVGTALAATACGSGTYGSSSSSSTGASPTQGGGGAIVSIASVDGTSTLVSSDGHTLYDAKAESPDNILCVDSCTSFWKPLIASGQQASQAASTLHQSFAVVSRPDGKTQLAYAGHPLYTFTQEGAHQLRGNGFTDEFQGTHFEWVAATTGGPASAPPSTGMATRGGGYGY